MNIDNLFSKIPDSIPEEIFEIILKTNNFKLERIISAGHATPQGEWYDQDTNELVILLSGSAGLLFKDGTEMTVMKPGDYLHIPAHKRHRVEWTDSTQKTIWLALHYPKSHVDNTEV